MLSKRSDMGNATQHVLLSSSFLTTTLPWEVSNGLFQKMHLSDRILRLSKIPQHYRPF